MPAACKVERPRTVLSDAAMEQVLYDYHIAKAMADELGVDDNYKKVLYADYVFHKHGITRADFDSSMVWYSRHPDVMAALYVNVNKQLKSTRDAINKQLAMRDGKALGSLPGDSVDIWSWQRIQRITGMRLNNTVAFSFPSDSNFHPTDTLRWSVRFRFPNGVPDSAYAPVMAMQLVYQNDNLVDSLLRVYRPGMERITLTSDTLGEIKEVRGFIYYASPPADKIRLLMTDTISLVRYHVPEKSSTPTDSTQIIPADSLPVVKKETTPAPKNQPERRIPLLKSNADRQELKSAE
jgi:hypothetical protein